MTYKEKLLNLNGLVAYQSGELDYQTKVMPGFEKHEHSSIQKYLRQSVSRAN